MTSAGAQSGEDKPQADGIWTAAVGDSARQAPAATAASSSSGSAAAHGSSVLLIPVQSRSDTASCIEQLVGACLQSILRRYSPAVCRTTHLAAAMHILLRISEGVSGLGCTCRPAHTAIQCL